VGALVDNSDLFEEVDGDGAPGLLGLKTAGESTCRYFAYRAYGYVEYDSPEAYKATLPE
jgi:hypothetical protein